MGRHSTYTKSKHDEIVDRLTSGELLEDICRDEHMPASRTIGDWRAKYPQFSTDIAHAREAGQIRIA